MNSRVLYPVFLVSGFAAILYQLVWQRALFRLLGTSSESVTLIVTAFMLGLGIGSLAGGAWSSKPGRPLVLIFGLAELGIGAFGLVSLRLFSWIAAETPEAAGLSIVRTLVGHGVGRDMHEDPQIPNYGTPGTGVRLEEGMVLAIEPMVTAGRHTVRVGDDHWAIYSQDGSLAAHFEFTVAITAAGPRILTPWHEASGGRAAA